jgi:hypothetical protein
MDQGPRAVEIALAATLLSRAQLPAALQLFGGEILRQEIFWMFQGCWQGWSMTHAGVWAELKGYGVEGEVPIS